MVNVKRIHLLKNGLQTNGPVVYWMSRDQRVNDNWALLFAQQYAFEKKRSLIVLFNLVPDFLEATIRQYGFMLKGLQQAESKLLELNIPFKLTDGNPSDTIPGFLHKVNASILVTDFDPLKIKRNWKREIEKKIKIPFYEVDAHNIVPVRYASQKQEFGAYTIRPKILNALPEFLEEFPRIEKMNYSEALSFDRIDWTKTESSLKINRTVIESNIIIPGPHAAQSVLKNFLENKFDSYSTDRNDPNKDAQSGLSPYIHFGQISAQRIALGVKDFKGNPDSEKAFLEELIVRRELSDNYCFYNDNYDNINGFPIWSKDTLGNHKKDKREKLYTLEEFEQADTYEDLWNAAQKELVSTGKLHGYMRMYWAKKILEWSKSPAEALSIAIYLNDKYSIDGRDPNGYTGCAWAIGGVHDRAWGERPVFGKIRYMNRNGAKKKFDISVYIKRFSQ